MEALKEFLDNMFRGVDGTTDVLRAKAELLQMMEDKYETLIADGKNENEAVGIVISEFGNFQEIADELGIADAVKDAPAIQKAESTQEEDVETVSEADDADGSEDAADVSESASVDEGDQQSEADVTDTDDTTNIAENADGADSASDATEGATGAGFAAGAATAAGMAAGAVGAAATGGAGAGFTGGAQDGAGAGQANYGNNQNNYGPNQNNYGNNQNNYGNNNKKRPRRWLNWKLEDVEKYLKYTKKHARFVAFGVALCILAPFINCVLEAVLSIGAPRAVVEAISDSMFFACIAGAVAFFIVAASQTKRYGEVNKDAVSPNGGAAMEIQTAGDEWAGRRTACVVVGIILIILGPAASSMGNMFPGLIGEIVDDSVLLFTAIGVGLLVYSSSVSSRFKDLAKGINRAKETDFSTFSGEVYGTASNDSGATGQYGAGQPGANDWTFKQKKGMPTWLLVLIIIFVFLTVNSAFNIFRGLPVITGFRGCGRVFGGGKTVVVDDKKSFDAAGINKIDVDLSASELTIEVTDQKEISVEVNGDFSEKPVVEKNGSDLKIGEQSGFSFFGWKTGSGNVKLRVPKDALISYDLDLSMGDVKVQGSGDVNAIQADKFNADLSAGKLSVKYMTAHQMDVDLSAGDLDIEGVKCDGKADFDLSAGAAKISNSDLCMVDADLALGSFEYELPEPKAQIADKYALDLDVSLGNIVFLDEKDGDEIRRDAKDESGEERYFKVDASLGSITIR